MLEKAAPPRALKTIDAALMVIGNVVGAGIFFVSGIVATHVGSGSAFIGLWVLGGLVALAGALVNGELGSLFPRGGGEYVYLSEAYGPLVGFLAGWASFSVMFPGSIAALSYGFGLTLCGVFGVTDPLSVVLTAAATALGLTSLNAFGLAPGKRLQNALSGAKILALSFLIVASFVPHSLPRAPVPLPPANADPEGSLALALVPILFAYSGWNVATYVAGEIKEPRRSLGRALVLGTAFCVVLYVGVNIVYLRELSLEGLRGAAEPARQALSALPCAGTGLSVLIAISSLSSLQASVVAGPRVYQAMAEDGRFFAFLRTLHPRSRVPVRALAVQAAVSLLLLSTGTFEQLVTFTTFGVVLFSTLTVGAVIVLRVRRPNVERAFRTPWYPSVPIFFILVQLWVLFATLKSSGVEALTGVAFILAGVPVYFWFSRRNAR